MMDVITLTNAAYSYEEYVDALRSYEVIVEGLRLDGVADRDRLAYKDLLAAFTYEADSRKLDNFLMHLSAVLDEDEDGQAWSGRAAKLVTRIRELIEDEDVNQ
jgi:hypothetical protein